MTQVVLDTPGTGTWTVPAGVTLLDSVGCIGAGNPGADGDPEGGNGGGGGAYAQTNNVAVTPGEICPFRVAQTDAGETTYLQHDTEIAIAEADSAHAYLHLGGNAEDSTGDIKYSGGDGGNASTGTGGGGGGAAGATGDGTNGADGDGFGGGAGGAGNDPGGSGGNGGGIAENASHSFAPGGGGGGGGMGGTGSAGQVGKIIINYTNPLDADVQSPVVTITTNGGANFQTTLSTVDLAGTATDNVGVVSMSWTNNRGGSGSISAPFANWTKVGIPLFPGSNVITIYATDAAQNPSGADSITVNYVAGTIIPTLPALR